MVFYFFHIYVNKSKLLDL